LNQHYFQGSLISLNAKALSGGHPPETKSVQTIYPTALLRGFFIEADRLSSFTSALLFRSIVCELKTLQITDLSSIIDNGLEDKLR